MIKNLKEVRPSQKIFKVIICDFNDNQDVVIKVKAGKLQITKLDVGK